MSKRVYREVKPTHYARLIRKLLAAKMGTLRPAAVDTIENTIFGVWKEPGVSQRLLWTGKRSNLLLNESLGAVELPSADIVSSLSLADEQKLRIGGCDISQYYNRLKAPHEIIRFLGLPTISAKSLELPGKSGRVTRCLTCVPMGATFLVAIGEVVTTAGLVRKGLPLPDSFSASMDSKVQPGRNVILPYIADITVIVMSVGNVNRDCELAASALGDVYLQNDEKKDVAADNDLYKALIGLA